MDEYSGKRAVNGVVVSRKGSGVALRDSANNRDNSSQFCNRLGCNGRLNYPRGAQNGFLEKAKASRPSFRSSSSGKEIIGSPSRTCSMISKGNKSVREPRKKLSCLIDTNLSETGSAQDESEVSELTAPPCKTQRGSENAESRSDTLIEVGSSSAASHTRSRRNLDQGSGVHSHDSLVTSSISLGTKSSGWTRQASPSRYGRRNLRCNSTSDVIPSGCSVSDSGLSKGKDVVKRRNYEGESSSSARGKKISGSSSEGQTSSSGHGISISDSRRARNMGSDRDNSVTSVRTRRLVNGHTRARLPNQGNGNSLSPNKPSIAISQVLQSNISVELNAPSSSHQFSAEIPSSRAISYSRPGSGRERLRGVAPDNGVEVGITHSSMNQDSVRRYNIDGIAEELLALEERMGTVSTALTEETLSECLKSSTYESTTPKNAAVGCSGVKDDVKCSICQEEFVVGDDMGRLRCEHGYHAVCIQQWLRLKNWCPICKASAAPSPSSSSS
ncbi:hypothetical protein CJ030_MR8G028172 [Morella rubra]|uniref:RING-type E3 ubiquitin transferase n=1 Tax=Morella rubra TaxID=262757 RepID=A0A6A1UVM0_9ROSI|nr:hypothetical protein CJ030_MR8G028172 [Morella rubra]